MLVRFFRKAALRRFLFPLSLTLVLTGCFSDFEPDIESSPVLCMSSLISDGDSIMVSLTHTWRWSDPNMGESGNLSDSEKDDPHKLFVDNAEIRLYVNGEYRETLKKFVEPYSENGFHWNMPYPWAATGGKYMKGYRAEYIPRSGDTIRLEAVSEEYGEAWAEVAVPFPVEIESVEYTARKAPDGRPDYVYPPRESIHFDMTMSVWFSDPADTENYYMFKTSSDCYGYLEREDGDKSYELLSFRDVTDEPLFTEHLSALDHTLGETSGYTFFSDRQISGKSYPLHISLKDVRYHYHNPDSDPELDNGTIDLFLYSISSSYYRHVISVWQANDGVVGSLGDIGLSDPIFAFSNVSTGAGVVAAAAKNKYSLLVKPIADSVEPDNPD